jgi:hypothetical protein
VCKTHFNNWHVCICRVRHVTIGPKIKQAQQIDSQGKKKHQLAKKCPPTKDHAIHICLCKGLGWRASLAYNVQLNIIIGMSSRNNKTCRPHMECPHSSQCDNRTFSGNAFLLWGLDAPISQPITFHALLHLSGYSATYALCISRFEQFLDPAEQRQLMLAAPLGGTEHDRQIFSIPPSYEPRPPVRCLLRISSRSLIWHSPCSLALWLSRSRSLRLELVRPKPWLQIQHRCVEIHHLPTLQVSRVSKLCLRL